jgi:hypothetical protein
MPRLRPAFAQEGPELGEGEGCGGGRVGCGGQEGAGLGPGDPAAGLSEGGEEAGVVLAQVGAQLVVGAGADPDGVLLGAGQHGDGLGELGVGGQRQPSQSTMSINLGATR